MVQIYGRNMENSLKIGDKVKGFYFEGRYGMTEWVSEMETYIGKVGTVITSGIDSIVVMIDFGDMSWWYPVEEAIKHKVNNDNMEQRKYTVATPLLKELWRLYQGKKEGSLIDVVYFDNCDVNGDSGTFYANDILDNDYEGLGYTGVNEDEFIDFMEFDKGLVEDAKETMGILNKARENQKVNDATDPQHYNQYSIQPLDYIMANHFDFCEGNIIKYVSRYKQKNGLEDLLKAKVYLQRLIDGYGK